MSRGGAKGSAIRGRRRLAALLTLALVLAAGAALDGTRDTGAELATSSAPPHQRPHDAEVKRLFEQAVVMLHARRFEHAAAALHRVLQLDPTLTEAHVNMGFALAGLQRWREARGFFESALALRPQQANAYYGLALAYEAEHDAAAATGAMRSYLHLARDERPEHLARARAALWEWQRAREPGAAVAPPR